MTPNTSHLLRKSALLLVVFFATPLVLHAADATIYLSPITGTYEVGTSATLRVLVSSGGLSVNAIEARLTYNPKEVSVTSVSEEGSVVTSWVQHAEINADVGEVVFGGSLATSTALERSLVVTLLMIPLRAGETRLRFESGAAIHAADGLGSNILTSLSGGQYIVNPKELNQELSLESSINKTSLDVGEVLGVATQTPPILITSASHPDQSAWYNASSSVFALQFEKEITRLRLGFSKKEDGVAGVSYELSIKEKIINDLDEGIWYFHLSADVMDGGVFSTHYRVQVDRSPPQDFRFFLIPSAEEANPNFVFGVTATDTYSGVDYYTFSIDGGKPEVWRDDGTHQFRYRSVKSGTHQIVATAFDRAGNTVFQTLSFEVGQLDTPVVMLNDETLREGARLSLSLRAKAGNDVSVAIARNGGEPIYEKFTVPAPGETSVTSMHKLQAGTYHVWAVAENGDGMTSKESDRVSVTVSASLFGLMSRHPFIPIALLALLLLCAFALRMWKKLIAVPNEAVSEVHVRDKLQKPQIQGAVVLQTRAKNARINVSRVTT